MSVLEAFIRSEVEAPFRCDPHTSFLTMSMSHSMTNTRSQAPGLGRTILREMGNSRRRSKPLESAGAREAIDRGCHEADTGALKYSAGAR